jgi:hypothetical protein
MSDPKSNPPTDERPAPPPLGTATPLTGLQVAAILAALALVPDSRSPRWRDAASDHNRTRRRL